MSRFLTPSKVALLCLISLYTEGIVPNTSAVPVLSFLISHIHPGIAAFRRDKSHAVSIDELEEVLAFHASSIPGRSVWDLLLRKMWLLDCCDALEIFFADIHSIVEKSREEQLIDRDNGVTPTLDDQHMRLSRASPLGAFVRRAQLEFTRLQFHDSVKLWRGFVKYRLPTYRAWVRRHPSGEQQSAVDNTFVELNLSTDSYLGRVVYGNIEDESDHTNDSAGISTKDVEQLLTFQVDELQQLGCRVSDQVKDQLEYILSTGVTVPSMSHYIRFLDAWRSGDYPSSFDHLHRYFDYTVHGRDRSFYQYALLNLAILHADFGSYAEAVSAMQEAIAIARESHDMDCLNFCMSWLYHFGKAFPEEMKDVQNTGMLGSEKEGLAFLKAKAKETESWGLLSTTLLSEAKLELQNGDSLASVFENIVKSSYLNVTRNLRTAMGPQLLLQASVFSRIGLTHNALLHCEIFRECYAKGAPLDDHLKIAYRSSQLLAHSGGYKRAMARISDTSQADLRSLKASQNWAYYCGVLKLQRQIYRDDTVAAEHLLSQLQEMRLPDIDLALHLSLMELEYRLRKGHHQKAMEMLDEVAQFMQQDNFDVLVQIRLLCFKARIFANTGISQRGFSLAMRAASIAYRSRVLPGLWEAIGVLATVLLSLREFEAAAEMMESIIPQVLELDDRYLTARSYSVLVDANMGLAGSSSSLAKGKRKDYILHASTYIDYAYDEYAAIEDVPGQCEMMAKKATVMHLTGEPVLANDYASKCLDLRRKAKEELSLD